MKASTRISGLAVAGIAAFSMVALPAAFAEDGELSDTEVAALVQNREEERLARDLYQAFSDQFGGAAPFSRIVNAEQAHFDAVGNLLTQYGIDDPSAGAAAGSFSDPALQGLYDQWFAEGSASLEAAYQVGIDLETQDIAGLEEDIAASETDAVRTVLERLQTGSEHHLTAYERAASGQLGTGQQGPNGQAGNNGVGQANRGSGQGAMNRQQTCDGTCDGTAQGAQQGGAMQGAQQGAMQGPRDGNGARGTGECPNA